MIKTMNDCDVTKHQKQTNERLHMYGHQNDKSDQGLRRANHNEGNGLMNGL